MTAGNSGHGPRFAIWLPPGEPVEREILERTCLDTVTCLNGQVVAVFHNDTDPLLAALQAGEFDTVVYPRYRPLVRDSLLAGIVHGVFRGLFGVTLCCVGDPDFLAVPHAFALLTQDVITNHLQSFYSQSLSLAGDHLPFGYRWVGNTVEVDPGQAAQVRNAFRDKAAHH